MRAIESNRAIEVIAGNAVGEGSWALFEERILRSHQSTWPLEDLNSNYVKILVMISQLPNASLDRLDFSI